MGSQFFRSEPQRQTAYPIASAGVPYIGASAFVTAIFALLGLAIPSIIGIIITFFICYFFRDPDRLIPKGDNIIVSPADGKVIQAEMVNNCPFINGNCFKISIFMTIFNVHVNRIPHEGVITDIQYFPGKFFSANLDKASRDNEHNAVFIRTPDNKTICVVQVAGLIARRIICGVQSGDEVNRGQKFGMICFGSRLDVYLPPESKPAVAVGNIVQAGSSIIGYLN